MAYKKMEAEKIYSIYRRRLDGQKILQISKYENIDRKTIRTYLTKLQEAGLSMTGSVMNREEVLKICSKILPKINRIRTTYDKFNSHLEEIQNLIGDPKEPLKPKTAFWVIREKYKIHVSYSTFKRFIKDENLLVKNKRTIIRIELPPGREAQIDYGKVGRLYDPLSKRNRDVYAYAATLAYSRLPFIQFVYKQDQVSFVNSTIDMFEFYGGVPEFISIDNLKSGVIKPDLYEPTLNKAFAEMAVHYDTFINPCRINTPTDKGKIERLVPVARELFRRLKNIHENITMYDLNEKSKDWSLNEYGNLPHGTTHIPPLITFLENEKEVLKSLPEERFEVPLWSKVKVHPDQFFEFEKKYYAMPAKYRGEWLNVRKITCL